MKTYNVNWSGIDRGHEGAWSPDVWRDVLNAIAKYSPVDLDDVGSQFYSELATRQPGIQWVTVSPTGDTRTFFRDGREPWASTGVASFNKGTKTATLTSVGRQVVEGKISYADVLASAALGVEENGEHPFVIILDAMRRAPQGVGLAYEDVVKVMRHYRCGDNIAEVLDSPNETISANSGRRLKTILLLMTYAGLAVHKGNLYYAGQDVTTLRTLVGADLREAFKDWITANNVEGSGKAASYITALEDADVIAQAFNEKFKLPSVYEMSDASLESLREFIAGEQNLESHTAGSSVLNGVTGLHGKSYWNGGHCSAAISSLLEFKRNLREENFEKGLPDVDMLNADRLTVALKLFQEARKETVSTGARYWVFSPGERACRWDEMRDCGYAALSYEGVNDLRSYADAEALRAVFQTREGNESSHKNDVRALMDFRDVMKPGDFVFAKKGTTTFLAVGRATGEYEFVADAPDYKHRRKVEWFKVETVEREDRVASKTLTDVTRFGDLVRELCEAYGVEVAVNADDGNWGCQDVRDWFDAFTPEKLKEDFTYFRSRMLWSKRVQGAIGREYTHIDELGAVMKELKESPRPIGYYASEEFAKKCPDGFGKSTATDFLMKFHPNQYISFTGNMMDALDFLGLWPKDVKRDMEVCYNELIGAATRVRNRMNDLDIGRFAEGKKPEADYLTVNEFLWWTQEHKDLIAEKAKAKKPEKDEPRPADVLSLAIQAFKANRTTWTDKLSKDKTVYECINLHVRDYFRRDHGWKIDELKSGEEKPFEAFFKDNTWMLTNGKGGWKNLSHYTDAERAEFVKWIDESIVSGPKALPEIFAKVESDFKGVTSKAATELLMKFHPDLYCLCNGPTIDALNFLRVLKEDIPEDYDYDAYMQVMGVCAYLRKRLNDAGIDRIEGEKGDPDYITVNEFLYFVSSNKDLIKEKVMKEQLKPIEADKTIKKGSRKLADAFKDDAMLQRLAAALRTKPFAILAGHSGTGKSQLVRRLAYMTCNNQKLIDEGKDKTAPGNYCMVQVKPNWHDSTDLLGYYSDLGTRHFVNTAFVQFLCKAYAYPQTPFFLCLDEMNLAPVEQYFAEYLSAVESLDEKDGIWLTDSLVEVAKEGDGKVDAGILMQIMRGAPSTEAAEWIAKHGLTIPKNLFVVGTVNMDETTCQFSRKVLDRAMTLLMNEVKFDTMGKSVDPKKEELLDEDGINFFLDGARKGMVGTDEVALLDNVNKPLKNTPFVIAYRFANEYALYEAALAKLRNAEFVSSVAAEAIDHVVLMKLLPRIHGEKSVVEEIFKGKDKSGGLCAAVGDGLSKTQMEAILERKAEYLTFWP